MLTIATTVRYRASTVKPVAPWAPTIAKDLMVIMAMFSGIMFNLFEGRGSIL